MHFKTYYHSTLTKKQQMKKLPENDRFSTIQGCHFFRIAAIYRVQIPFSGNSVSCQNCPKKTSGTFCFSQLLYLYPNSFSISSFVNFTPSNPSCPNSCSASSLFFSCSLRIFSSMVLLAISLYTVTGFFCPIL